MTDQNKTHGVLTDDAYMQRFDSLCRQWNIFGTEQKNARLFWREARAALEAAASPQSPSNLVFCENCGKEMAEHDRMLHCYAPVATDEQSAFETWLAAECPSGDAESVQKQWKERGDYADLYRPAAAMPVAPVDERAAFAWHMTGRGNLMPHDVDNVINYNIACWFAWQARASLAVPTPPTNAAAATTISATVAMRHALAGFKSMRATGQPCRPDFTVLAVTLLESALLDTPPATEADVSTASATVPVDPTPEMSKAWNTANGNSESYFSPAGYRAMLHAAIAARKSTR